MGAIHSLVCGLRFSQCGMVSDVRAQWLSCGIWLWVSYRSSCFGWVICTVEAKIYSIHHWERASGETLSLTHKHHINSDDYTAIRLHSPFSHYLFIWVWNIQRNTSAVWHAVRTEGKGCQGNKSEQDWETPGAVKGLVNAIPIALFLQLDVWVCGHKAGEVMMVNASQ